MRFRTPVRGPRYAVLAVLLLPLCSALAESAGLPSAPPGYPLVYRGDAYSETPIVGDYEDRRNAYLLFQVVNPGSGPFSEMARMRCGVLPDESQFASSFERLEQRLDCADFRLHAILRLLYQFGDCALASDVLLERARAAVLGFKYWPDEPGIDSMCYWSENHFILYAAGGYLAGQLYPDETFTNSGQTGREKMAICRPRVLRWLDLRFKTGFSEWLSNVYYAEDLLALLSLIDFCEDEEIATRAAMVTDLILLDMALNSHRGAFAATRGRTYEFSKKWGEGDNTGAVSKLVFGVNMFSTGSQSATPIALSANYRPPRVLFEIASGQEAPGMVNCQRSGFRVEEAKRWGLSPERLEDGMTFLTAEAYAHPKIINLTLRMFDEYQWWENSFFAPFAKQRSLLNTARKCRVMPLVAWWYRKDVQRNYRACADIYTYRTPDYMLSTAQDYRKGYGGDQQHVWHAALGPAQMCFTTHPVPGRDESPDYWTGSGNLPRAAQVKNVVIVLYDISTRKGLYVTHHAEFTHAWLPKDMFEEFIERDGWYFGRHGQAYLALWSRQPCHWQTQEGRDRNRELIAPGKKNIWLCELGRQSTDGSFDDFMERIANAPVETDGLRVRYESPSQGTLEFGWRGPLKQNGTPIRLHGHPRYANPYVSAPYPAEHMRIEHNGHWLELDWAACARRSSG